VPPRSPRVLVLDAMGVIYDEGNLVESHVIPFARHHGCELSDRDILGFYLRASAGEMSSSGFWHAIGVDGAAPDLDAQYVSLHRLSSGLLQFLQRMRSGDVRVVCLSNDVAEWSLALRQMHGLHERIDHWTVSGDVACRKPDVGIYEALLRDAALRADECLFVDDKEPNLDVARGLGFHTCLFAPVAAPAPDGGQERADLTYTDFQLGSSSAEDSTHAVARTFDEVGALLAVDADDVSS
jgi:putative hydrolase of the HAD superfamily